MLTKRFLKFKNRESNLLEQCNPTPMLPKKTPEGKRRTTISLQHYAPPPCYSQNPLKERKKEKNNNIIATLCPTLMLQ